MNVIKGRLYFLLGQDRPDGHWSDYGGRSEECDQGDPMETAARELYEETSGCLMDMDGIKKRLKDPTCHMILESKTMGGARYFMYVMHCPYMSHVKSTFQNTLKFLKHIKANRRYMEKTDMSWFPAEDVINSAFGIRNGIPLREVFAATVRLHADALAEADKHVVSRYPSPNRLFDEDDNFNYVHSI
jgi:hypothetical protein